MFEAVNLPRSDPLDSWPVMELLGLIETTSNSWPQIAEVVYTKAEQRSDSRMTSIMTEGGPEK